MKKLFQRMRDFDAKYCFKITVLNLLLTLCALAAAFYYPHTKAIKYEKYLEDIQYLDEWIESRDKDKLNKIHKCREEEDYLWGIYKQQYEELFNEVDLSSERLF